MISNMMDVNFSNHNFKGVHKPGFQGPYLGILSMNWFDNIVFDDIFNFNILNFFSCSFNSWSRSCFNKVSEFLVMLILKVKVDIVIPTRDPRTPRSKSARNSFHFQLEKFHPNFKNSNGRKMTGWFWSGNPW